MEMIEILNNILLSDNVVEQFKNTLNSHTEFKAWLYNILPEAEDCQKQIQRNPWHKYNVWEHILHSVEAMNKQTATLTPDTRKILAYTMFLHDIGKPKHHVERIVDGKPRDSFYNHNIGSEKIARRFLTQLGFDPSEIATICKLVHKHDIFMFIRDFPTTNPHWRTLTPALIQEEINDLNSVGDGRILMEYLIMIGRADNLAQNEKMTPPSLRLLDKMHKMLQEFEKERIYEVNPIFATAKKGFTITQ